MNTNFSQIIQSLPSLTVFFIIVTSALGTYFLTVGFSKKTITIAPTVLTSIGIFGTFLGIALGLSHFNTEDIQGSVPMLIAGLKTAFWSSVVGVFFAMLIKARQLYKLVLAKKEQNNVIQGATIEDIVSQLVEVNKSLVGEEESTLLSQIKLMRQDSNDKLDKLKGAMEDFISNMAENNSKALIEALEGVIRDFNTKINEQFGENFKHLNEAVEKILLWQEKYKSQMEEMIEQQETVTRLMKQATGDYETLVDKSASFNETSERLAKTIETLEQQREHIFESVQKLGEIIESAKTGLPLLEDKISSLVSQVTQGTEDSNNKIHSTIESVSDSMDKLINQTNEQFNRHIDSITQKTGQHVENLEAAMEKELTTALESFGKQLAALSEKFVEDYTPLTEKLKQVVNMARL